MEAKTNSENQIIPFELSDTSTHRYKKKKEGFSLELINGKIEAKVGEGTNFLNKETVATISQNFLFYLQKKNLTNIFITHDSTFNGIFFSKIFASILKEGQINVYFNYNNQSLNNAMSIYVANKAEIKFDIIVNFSRLLDKESYKISFLDSCGLFLSSKVSKEINSCILDTNYLVFNFKNINNVPFLQKNYANKYVDDVILNDQTPDGLKIMFSNVSECNKNVLENYLSKTSLKYKINAINDNKSYKLNSISRTSLIKSWGKKFDLLINFLNNDNFEFFIKHKNRKKIITYNELAIIYLYYKLNFDNHTDQTKKILLSYDANPFIKHLAKKQGNTYKVCDDLDTNIKKEKEQILIATNGQDYFISDKNNNCCNDPISNIKTILMLVAFFKKQNKTLYDLLMDIYKKEEFHRFNFQLEEIGFEEMKKMFFKIENATHINDQKIIRKREVETQNKTIEITFEDHTKIIFEYNKNNSILKTTYSLWSNEKQITNKKNDNENLIKLIIREKKYIDAIKNLKGEIFTVAKFSWKSTFKYVIFVFLFILFFYFIFNFILGADKRLFEQIKMLITTNKVYGYMLPTIILLLLLWIFLDCWMTKRIITLLNEKIKLRHLMISSIIGICVSTITPLIYGGESVSYWYLRRKGAKRAPIVAMFLIRSMFTQISIILGSIILIPIAFTQLVPHLLNNNPNSISIMVLITIGALVDLFAAIVISFLTFNKRIQKYICRNLSKFIEWIPFIVSRDSQAFEATMEYNFDNINVAAKKIFHSKYWVFNLFIFLELLFYRMVLRFVDIGPLLAISTNMLKQNTFVGYIYLLSGGALVRAINSLNFITPGGIGISDWAAKSILVPLFINGDDVSNANNFNTINVYQTMNRILFTISWVIISGLMLLTIYIGESRIDKYNLVKKTLSQEEIDLGNIKTKSIFYKHAIAYWVFGVALVFASWILIFKFLIL